MANGTHCVNPLGSETLCGPFFSRSNICVAPKATTPSPCLGFKHRLCSCVLIEIVTDVIHKRWNESTAHEMAYGMAHSCVCECYLCFSS